MGGAVMVGLLSPRSTLNTMARETAARAARSESDQPRLSRSMRMRAPMRRSMPSELTIRTTIVDYMSNAYH